MVKALAPPTPPVVAGQAWLKVKAARTLDLVVLAAEWGHGRRHGLVEQPPPRRARRAAPGGFVMLGKTFKGLTDERLAWQTAAAAGARGRAARATPSYVRPELVVEIAFNDVQDSPQYPGGVALRFARVIRYRDDKTAAEASTLGEVLALRARPQNR